MSQSAAEIRDVFGDSDDEEEPVYTVRNEIEQDSNVRICLQSTIMPFLT